MCNFELLTASFASKEFDLKTDWAKIKADFKPYKVLEKTSNIDIIQAITIFATYKRRKSHELKGETENLTTVSAKRKEMLNLSLSDYINYRDQIVSGFIKASKILGENHIFNSRDIPYSTQLVPLASILARLGNET